MAYERLLTDSEMTQIAFWLLVGMGLFGLVIDGIRKIWAYIRTFRKPEVTGNPDAPETEDMINA